MQDILSAIDELFEGGEPTRDETGSLAAVARLLDGLEPAWLVLADAEGNLASVEAWDALFPTQTAASLVCQLATETPEAGLNVCRPTGDWGNRWAFGLRLSEAANRAILGGLLGAADDVPQRLEERTPILALAAELAARLITSQAEQMNLQTRIRHLLAECDTLKASHTEVVNKAIEEHQERLYESKRRAAVEELCRAAEAASHAKSEFLANMSHELRTPLHGILSFATFGTKKAETASREDLLQYFLKIERGGKTLLALINDLLDLSKLESGRATYDFAPLDLRPLAVVVLDEFTSMLEHRRIAIHFADPGFPTKIVGDQTKLMQVLRNLLSNAIKFSPDGSTIEIELLRHEQCLALSVCDQGVGIPEDELEAIFDKFIQSSKTRTGAGGTGLGLAICREIVNTHQGRIWAENRAEGGARITFEVSDRLKPGKYQASPQGTVPAGTVPAAAAPSPPALNQPLALAEV